jgi:hypothetical protein
MHWYLAMPLMLAVAANLMAGASAQFGPEALKREVGNCLFFYRDRGAWKPANNH